jgi:hypothetical protein
LLGTLVSFGVIAMLIDVTAIRSTNLITLCVLTPRI